MEETNVVLLETKTSTLTRIVNAMKSHKKLISGLAVGAVIGTIVVLASVSETKLDTDAPSITE